MNQEPTKELNRSCGHVMPTGTTCGAYALIDSEFCYWHQKALETRKRRTRSRKASGLVLPLLEDANSIQLAIQMISQAVADRRISRAESGALLYSIQLAMMNLKNFQVPKAICQWDVRLNPSRQNELGDFQPAHDIAIEDDPHFNYGEPDEDEDDGLETKPDEIAYAEAFINKNLAKLKRLGVVGASTVASTTSTG